MPEPEPVNDIGPYWKAVGFVVVLLVAVFVLRGQQNGHDLTTHDLILIGGLILLLLAILRPRFLDNWMKTFANWLPFTKYQKPPE